MQKVILLKMDDPLTFLIYITRIHAIRLCLYGLLAGVRRFEKYPDENRR